MTLHRGPASCSSAATARSRSQPRRCCSSGATHKTARRGYGDRRMIWRWLHRHPLLFDLALMAVVLLPSAGAAARRSHPVEGVLLVALETAPLILRRSRPLATVWAVAAVASCDRCDRRPVPALSARGRALYPRRRTRAAPAAGARLRRCRRDRAGGLRPLQRLRRPGRPRRLPDRGLAPRRQRRLAPRLPARDRGQGGAARAGARHRGAAGSSPRNRRESRASCTTSSRTRSA